MGEGRDWESGLTSALTTIVNATGCGFGGGGGGFAGLAPQATKQNARQPDKAASGPSACSHPRVLECRPAASSLSAVRSVLRLQSLQLLFVGLGELISE